MGCPWSSSKTDDIYRTLPYTITFPDTFGEDRADALIEECSTRHNDQVRVAWQVQRVAASAAAAHWRDQELES